MAFKFKTFAAVGALIGFEFERHAYFLNEYLCCV
ncbi:hypothetical protein L245_03140 [Salmonella enterica subsp. enterica serovar Worthington str. BCH-4719]|nr:hypothetical protein L245_03140 [Salmonella enterica subsp. enterica serovar Worthington str. BCH-4719]